MKIKFNVGDILQWYGNEISLCYITEIETEETFTAGRQLMIRTHIIRKMNYTEHKMLGVPLRLHVYDYVHEARILTQQIKQGSMLHYKVITTSDNK